MRAFAGAIVLWALAACAGPRLGTTWEQDEAEGIVRTSTSPDARRARRTRSGLAPVTIGPNLPPPLDPEEVAHQLELDLIHFTAAQPKRRRAFPKTESWPAPIEKAFVEILTRLEKVMEYPSGTLPRRLLVQARVTIDAEIELTERRFGKAPSALAKRAKALYGQLYAHLRAGPRDAREEPLHPHVRLGWPVSPLVVTSPFGFRRDPILGPGQLRFHAGVDLGGQSGDVVSAAAPGRVSGAGWAGGHGRTVTVQHAGGVATVYAHLRRILVRTGQEVKAGTPVGLVGTSGRSTGPHLHFEVRSGAIPIDPLDVLESQSQVAARTGS